MWKAFCMALLSAITLQILNPFRTGKLVLFQVFLHRKWHGFEMIFFIILGIAGGFLGAWFIRLNLYVSRLKASHPFISLRPMLQVIVVTIISCILSYPFSLLKESMPQLLVNLFRECGEIEIDNHGLCLANGSFLSTLLLVSRLLFAGIIKWILTTVTFGLKVPAGVFIPSMVYFA